MATKKVVGVKLNEKEYEQVEAKATLDNVSVSAALRLLINGYLNGEIQIEKGELKIPEKEYELIEDAPLGQKLEKQFDKLRERGYPERYIRQMGENLVESVRSQIDMMPKRFDPRRMRDNDCGC